MMISVLLIALAQVAPSTAPAFEEHRVRNSLEMPREIAPAIVPYFKCTMEATNTHGAVSTGEEFRIAKQRAIASCSQVRAEAKAAALNMLSRTDIATEDREAFVEKALTSIDHAQDGVADRLDKANADHSPQDQ
jgi:hypothetical protein